MRAQSGEYSTETILAKDTIKLDGVPVRDIENASEAIALGFRQSMLELGPGSVSTGAGLGTDWIILEWDGKTVVVRGSELLKAWVSTFAPEDAARFPEGVR